MQISHNAYKLMTDTIFDGPLKEPGNAVVGNCGEKQSYNRKT